MTKKKKKAVDSTLPKRLYVYRETERYPGTIFAAVYRFIDVENTDEMKGGQQNVGEYVLVTTGTVKSYLGAEGD